MPEGRSQRARALALCAIVGLALAASCSAEPSLGGHVDPPFPPHVFLLIGDGMGYGLEIAASRYLSGSDEGLAWHAFPFRAWAATWDTSTYEVHAAAEGAASFDGAASFADASFDPRLGYDPAMGGTEAWPLGGADDKAYLVGAATDSAAAATSMATGTKTASGEISWRGGIFGRSLPTIAEYMRARLGASIGLISTVPFDHATPAAFVAHDATRNDYAGIARQIIETAKPELVIGGGHPLWRAGYIGTGALGRLRASPYWLLAEREAGKDGGDALTAAAALAAATAPLGTGTGLFGLFGGADGAFETPRPIHSPGSPGLIGNAENPSLARSVTIAAELLARNPEGFFLMAEQGDIDWANHDNDLNRALGATISLDEAARAVIAFVDRPGDDLTWANSLLIVVADHATGFVRFTDSGGMPRGVLPSKSGATYAYPGGTTLNYGSTGHSNELVGLAAMGDLAGAAFAPYVGEGRPGTRIVENAAIFSAMRDFSGLR